MTGANAPFVSALSFLLMVTLFTVASIPAQKIGLRSPSPQIGDGKMGAGGFTDWEDYACKSVRESTNPNFEHITTDNELKLNYQPPTASDVFTFTDNANPSRTLVGPPDVQNTITTQRSGNSLSWTSTKAIAAVIIGAAIGSPGRLYTYPEGTFGESSLTNPGNSSITSVNFCYYQPATVTIIKEVQTFSGSNAAPFAFPFTSTNLPAPAGFSLTDNDGPPNDRRIVDQLYKFAKLGSNNWITVTESPTIGWTLADLTCTDQDTVFGQTQFANVVDLLNGSVTIKLEEGEHVTCVFKNLQLIPSAGDVTVSGRVSSGNGIGIRGVSVILTDLASGARWYSTTGSFGNYRFKNLEAGQLYSLWVGHKRYIFAPDIQFVSPSSDATGLDFVAQP